MTAGRYAEVATVSAPPLVRLAQAAAGLPPLAGTKRSSAGGPYLSAFKGRGMEFDEVRPYEPGDDIRTLDWKVTARTGTPHTKLFREERERPVVLCLDLRRPMFFATRGAFKAVAGAYLATLLGWNANRGGDRVGAVLFDDTDHMEVQPQRGRAAVLHFIERLTAHPSWQHWPRQGFRPEALAESLRRLRNVCRPGSTVFVLSDFRGLDGAAEQQLVGIGRHTDAMLVHLHDPLEAELPPPGRYRVTDGTREVQLETGGDARAGAYRQRFEAHSADVARAARKAGMRYLRVSTAEDPVNALAAGLGRRRR